jgi:hypothetical protein
MFCWSFTKKTQKQKDFFFSFFYLSERERKNISTIKEKKHFCKNAVKLHNQGVKRFFTFNKKSKKSNALFHYRGMVILFFFNYIKQKKNKQKKKSP